MDKQISIPDKSLSILVGPPPPLEDLPKIRSCFIADDGSPSVFRQVVILSTQNLVQLCNFTRRCRKERESGKRFKYLVLFHFIPHQDGWHLLTVAREFDLTIVLFGGVCTEYAIRELFDYNPCCVAEWYQRKVMHGRPMICARTYDKTGPGRIGILKMFGGGISSIEGDIDGEVTSTLGEWAKNRLPETFTAMRFHSMTGFRRNVAADDGFAAKSGSGATAADDGRPKNAHATATMTIAKACQLLGIAEAQCMNEDVVRKAYRIKAMKYHPDKQTTEEEKTVAHNMFTQIGDAKRYLDDLMQRQPKR